MQHMYPYDIHILLRRWKRLLFLAMKLSSFFTWLPITSTLLAKVRFDHPNVALDALQRTPLLPWSDSGISNIFVHCWSLVTLVFSKLTKIAGKQNGDTATAAFGQEQWQLYLWSPGLCWGARKEDNFSGAVSHSQLESFASIWYPRWKWIHSPWTSKESQEVAPQKNPTSVSEFSVGRGVFSVMHFCICRFLYLQVSRL